MSNNTNSDKQQNGRPWQPRVRPEANGRQPYPQRIRPEDRPKFVKKKQFEITVPRLILRNLNFKVKEDQLKNELAKYGQINDLKLPKKPDGTPCGYGFVSYSNKTEAINAMKNINEMQDKLLGTKVVVDWCLPKDVYLKNQENKEEKTEQKDEQKAVKSEEQDDSESEASEKNSEDEDEDEDEDASDDDKDQDKDENDAASEEDEKDDDDDDDDDDDKDEEDDKKPKQEEKLKKKVEEGTRDVQEKRTIFIRNISYDTTADQLVDEFSKFGNVKFCKLCYDRDFERPKGTAFLQFETAESALAACGESNILELDFRKLYIDLAMSRKEINDIVVEKKTKIPEDRRNITLAKEGFIDPNSDEGKKLPKSDLTMRAKLEQVNNAKLKLLHHFVSTTRLSVHNLPTKCTDAELKKIFLNLFKDDRDARIVECRIMRDLKRVNSDGVARSRGFGFVQFTKFEHARKALHAINNNPNVFDDKRTRLIVQFSIEDMRALKKKEIRLEKEAHKKGKSSNGAAVRSKKKSKKNRKDDDEQMDPDKRREKNLLRLNILEKKQNKRKLVESRKQSSDEVATKRQKKNNGDVGGGSEKNKFGAGSRLQNKRKRQNTKRRLNQVKGDNVDKLVDKYLNEKNKVKDKKWYE